MPFHLFYLFTHQASLLLSLSLVHITKTLEISDEYVMQSVHTSQLENMCKEVSFHPLCLAQWMDNEVSLPIDQAKNPTSFYQPFTSAIETNFWNPFTSRATVTAWESWTSCFPLISTQQAPILIVYRLQWKVKGSWKTASTKLFCKTCINMIRLIARAWSLTIHEVQAIAACVSSCVEKNPVLSNLSQLSSAKFAVRRRLWCVRDSTLFDTVRALPILDWALDLSLLRQARRRTRDRYHRRYSVVWISIKEERMDLHVIYKVCQARDDYWKWDAHPDNYAGLGTLLLGSNIALIHIH